MAQTNNDVHFTTVDMPLFRLSGAPASYPRSPSPASIGVPTDVEDDDWHQHVVEVARPAKHRVYSFMKDAENDSRTALVEPTPPTPTALGSFGTKKPPMPEGWRPSPRFRPKPKAPPSVASSSTRRHRAGSVTTTSTRLPSYREAPSIFSANTARTSAYPPSLFPPTYEEEPDGAGSFRAPSPTSTRSRLGRGANANEDDDGPRPPSIRSIWRWRTTSNPPPVPPKPPSSIATAERAHPFLSNIPLGPETPVLTRSVVLPFVPTPPSSTRYAQATAVVTIAEPMARVKEAVERRTTKKRKKKKTFAKSLFMYGFLFPPIWLVGALLICMKPHDVVLPEEDDDHRISRQYNLAPSSPLTPTPSPGPLNPFFTIPEEDAAIEEAARADPIYTMMRRDELKWARRSLTLFAVFCVLISIALGLYLSFDICFRSCG